MIECLFIAAAFGCAIVGTLIAGSHPIIASLLIGLAMQQAGWIGHDLGHGRGKLSFYVSLANGCLINGFSSNWWSHKHNMHHAFPNRLEYDEDIDLSPVVYLWFPKADADSWHRKYQHIYYPFAYSLNYVSWRIKSLRFVIGSGENLQRVLIALDYIWLFTLPWRVSVASVIIGGLLVALVVTQSHQSETIIQPDEAYCFVND